MIGDVLDQQVDVLICTANPQLNLSGGVNGAILVRGGIDVQNELRQYLRQSGQPHVSPGTVVRTGPGPLKVQHILHAVAVDAFYGSSVAQVASTLSAALDAASQLSAVTVATPMLATGYGPLTAAEFGQALAEVVAAERPPIEVLRVVVRKPEQADILRAAVGSV